MSITIQGILDLAPFSGHLFVFCNLIRDAIKVLHWDRNGLCLWHKRLGKDRFCWPKRVSEVMNITPQGAHQKMHCKSALL